MSAFRLKRFLLEDSNLQEFEALVQTLYPADSPRFKLGHDPSPQHLEGLYLLFKEDIPVGRFAFYENPHLRLNDERVACIGSYECVEDPEVSQELLRRAKALAKEKSYSTLTGPMEGSTWNSYRFSLHNEVPNFFMEPYHHTYYNQQFEAFGFKPLADYFSAIVQSEEIDFTRLLELEKRFQKQGAQIQSIDPGNFSRELEEMAQLSLAGFAANFLYSPIAVADFVRKYAAIKTYMDPDLILTARNRVGELEAFIFCIPDLADPKRETIIIKSMVRKPGTPFKGIGSYLSLKVMQLAKEKGFKRVIHAMMISNNASLQISRKTKAKVFKEYRLYALSL